MSANNDKSNIQVDVETRVFCFLFLFWEILSALRFDFCLCLYATVSVYVLVTHNRAIRPWLCHTLYVTCIGRLRRD